MGVGEGSLLERLILGWFWEIRGAKYRLTAENILKILKG